MKVCKIERYLSYIDFLQDPTKSVEEKIVKIKEFENLKTDEEVLKNLGVPREKRKEEIIKALVTQREKGFT